MDDLISRQAAIDALWKIKDERDSVYYTSAIHTAIDAVEQLPSAQPTEASCWGCNCPKMERPNVLKTFSEMAHLHDAERRTDE